MRFNTATMGDFVHGDQTDLKLAHEKHVHEHEPNEKDLEAGLPSYEKQEGVVSSDVDTESAEIIRARELQQRTNILRKMREGEEWLDAKMGIETQGIDRIHEEDKRPPSLMNVFWLWWSLTCHVGTIPIGILGPELGLSFNQSVAAIVVGTMLGALCTSYCGTLGPKVSIIPLTSPYLA